MSIPIFHALRISIFHVVFVIVCYCCLVIFMYFIQASRYENVEYRYNWFHKYLSQYKDSYGKVFPSDWGVLVSVAASFCEITKFFFLPCSFILIVVAVLLVR